MITVTQPVLDACCCNDGPACSYTVRAKEFQGCFGGRPVPSGDGSMQSEVIDARSVNVQRKIPSPNIGGNGATCYPPPIDWTNVSAWSIDYVYSQPAPNYINYVTTTTFTQSSTGFWGSGASLSLDCTGQPNVEACPPWNPPPGDTCGSTSQQSTLLSITGFELFPTEFENVWSKDPEVEGPCSSESSLRNGCCPDCSFQTCSVRARMCGDGRTMTTADPAGYSYEGLANASFNSGNSWVDGDNQGYLIPADFTGKTVTAFETSLPTRWLTGGSSAKPTCVDAGKALMGTIFVTNTTEGEDYIIGFNLTYLDYYDPDAEPINTAIGIIVEGGPAEIEQEIEVPLRDGFYVSISACGAIPATPENLDLFLDGLSETPVF